MLVHVLIDQALSGQHMYNQNQVQNHHDRMKENSDNIMFHNDKDYSMLFITSTSSKGISALSIFLLCKIDK